jgi:DNA-binding transcriptional MerR regulator
VGVETIRFYERRGLIARPAKPRAGYRSYPEETVERVRFIRRAREYGFALEEIRELLQLSSSAGCKDMCARVSAKVRDLDARIAALTALRDELRGLLRGSPGRGAADQCAVIRALRRG